MKSVRLRLLALLLALVLLASVISCTRTVYVTPAPTPSPTPTPILIPDKWAAIDIVKAYLLDSAKSPYGKDVLASVWQTFILGTAVKQQPSSQYPNGRWFVTFHIDSSFIENSTLLASIFTILGTRYCGTTFDFETMTPTLASMSCADLTDKNLHDYGVWYSMSWAIGPEKQVNPYDANSIRFLAEISR